MDTSIIDRVSEQMKLMPQEKQLRVLEFVTNIAAFTPRGVPGLKTYQPLFGNC